jgi:hypothetical protein
MGNRIRFTALSLLLILLLMVPSRVGFAQQARHAELSPTDDAYVVADLNNPADPLGLRTLNTGSLTFLKAWYAWNVSQAGTEKVISLVYLKFNLAPLSADSISSAKLQLFASKVNLTGASRAVAVYFVQNNGWSEKTLTFNNAPGFNNTIYTTSYVSFSGQWYTFDVTSMAKMQVHSQLSLMVALALLYEHNEEQVVFNSNEASSNQPKLVVNYIGPSLSPIELISAFVFTFPGFLITPAIAAGGGVGAFLFVRRYGVLRKTGQKAPKTKRTKKSEPLSLLDSSSPSKAGVVGGRRTRIWGRKTVSMAKSRRQQSEEVCSKCGKPVEAGFKLCPYCGTKIS